MTLSIAALALDGFVTDLTITRTGPGSFVDGLPVPGTASTIAIKGVPLAISARDLRDLPEGIREGAELTLYSRSEIRTEDELTVRGIAYRVTHVWPRVEGGYHKATLAKRQAPR